MQHRISRTWWWRSKSKAFPCTASNCSEMVMKGYFVEEHHTGANFPEMVALAMEDLAGQKLLRLITCSKRMCKSHRKVLEMVERLMMSRVYPSMSVAELKS